LVDAETRETVRETMGTCTSNSRTTDNSVIGRRKLPFSLFNTSLQLCPSVHLSVHCKADRSLLTEEDNLYIDCQKQRRFSVRTVVNKYFARNWAIQTCDKLKPRNTMSDADIMAASFSSPSLCFITPDETVTPSCLVPVVTFFGSWMWQSHVPLLHNVLGRTLPGSCSFGAFCRYPYAEFLMACFQYTYRRSIVHCHDIFSQSSSVSDSCSCNSINMSTEHKPSVCCASSVGPYHCEAKANSVNVSLPTEFDGAILSVDDSCDLASDSDVMQPRNYGDYSGNDLDNKNTDMRLSGCIATVPDVIIRASVTDDDEDNDNSDSDERCSGNDYNGSSLKNLSFGACCLSAAPLPATSGTDVSSSTDKSHFRSSFFVAASNSDTSDDDDDDDDDDEDAASDESDCWDDDDSGWTSPADAAQCFLVDLDPFKVNGLYIPRTSNVPVSHSQCLSLQVDLAAEIESKSERALKRINDTWHQWYNDDTGIKSLSDCQHQTKHVCIFMLSK